jgi:hypothetical protein
MIWTFERKPGDCARGHRIAKIYWGAIRSSTCIIVFDFFLFSELICI